MISHRALLAPSIVVSLTLAACNRPDSTTTPVPRSDTSTRLTAAEQTITLDEHFSALGDSIPGFAGMVLNQGSTAIIVLLTDLNQKARVIQVLPVYRKKFRIGPMDRELPFEYRAVKYSWKQLEAWTAAIAPIRAALGTRALRRFDIDELNNRLDFGVADDEMVASLTAAIAPLGIPADAYLVRVVGPYVPTSPTINDAAIEFMAGYQIHVSGEGLCTAGYLTLLNDVNPRPRAFVTAAHCSNTVGAVDPNAVFQPHQSSGTARLIGSELRDATPFTCPEYSRCRYSDAAYVSFSSSAMTWEWSRGARTEWDDQLSGSKTISTTFPVFDYSGREIPMMNQRLSKIGIETGWTTGKVTNTNVDFYQPSNERTTIDVYFLDQMEADFGCGEGDSGGPVFTALTSYTAGQTVNSVGISTFKNTTLSVCGFSPMGNVARDNGAIEEYSS